MGGIIMIKTVYIQSPSTAEIQEKDQSQEYVSNEGKVLPVCQRCAQIPKNGLYDGFRLKGMFFCSDCQRELFTAEQDSPEYQEFLFLVKGHLFNQ
jgi:hypothetical protein